MTIVTLYTSFKMSSLRGLIAVIGLTTFAGIAGLYLLEQLCFGDKTTKKVNLSEFSDEELGPYALHMDNVENNGVEMSTINTGDTPRNEVLFEYNDEDQKND